MRQIDFEHGGIAQNILKAALPMLVAQVLNLLYNIVDRIYIARIPDIGTAALGAVGLCFPIIVIITAFSNLFGSGGAPLFAIARGSGDKARAGLILNLACTLLLCCAGVLMVIGLLFARPILVLFGASPEALPYALPYLMLYLLGTYPSMLTTGLNPFINAQGYATAGMLSVVIGAAANLVLDPVFIFVLGMGIRGAAAATVLSQLLSAAFVVYFLRCKSEYRVQPLPLRQLPANRRCIGDIVSLGTAGFIMQLTNSVVTICCNNVLSVTGGDVYISVMTIISSVRQMVETPIYAITEGSSPHYQLQLRRTPPPQGAARRRLHGPDGFGIHPYDLGGHSVGTALPHLHFQQRSHPAGGYYPRHEAVFFHLWFYAAAICGPDSVQIAEQAPPRGVFLAAAQGHHCGAAHLPAALCFWHGHRRRVCCGAGFQRDRRQFVLYCNADYRFAGAETDGSGGCEDSKIAELAVQSLLQKVLCAGAGWRVISLQCFCRYIVCNVCLLYALEVRTSAYSYFVSNGFPTFNKQKK